MDPSPSPRLVPFFLVVLVLLAGCLNLKTGTPPAQYYLLSSLPEQQPVEQIHEAGSGPVVGVGPISLPRHLDRPQIVTMAGPNELRLSEFHRWAEPLQNSITRRSTRPSWCEPIRQTKKH